MNAPDLLSAALSLTLYGMLVVFSFLSILVACTSLMSMLARRISPAEKSAAAAAPVDSAAASAAAAAASHHHRSKTTTR